MEPAHETAVPSNPDPAARPAPSSIPGLLPFVAVLAAVLLWGSSFAAMRVALRALNPWSVMWIRMAVALAFIAPFAARLLPRDLRRAYRKGDWRLLALLVLSEPCLYYVLESNALRFTTSSQAGVVCAAIPLLVSLGAWLFLSERMSGAGVVGLALSIGGVAGLTFLGAAAGAAANAPLGNALELGAAIAGASYTLLSSRLGRRYSPWSLTAVQLAAGVLFFLPGLGFLLREGWRGFPWGLAAAAGAADSPWVLVGVLAFLGGLVTLVAFGCYNWGLSRLPASRASLFLNLIPVIAVLIGWGLLGESLTVGQSLSVLAVIGGVLLGQRLRRPAPLCRGGA